MYNITGDYTIPSDIRCGSFCVDTKYQPIRITLPPDPQVGDTHTFFDLNGTFRTNPLLLAAGNWPPDDEVANLLGSVFSVDRPCEIAIKYVVYRWVIYALTLREDHLLFTQPSPQEVNDEQSQPGPDCLRGDTHD